MTRVEIFVLTSGLNLVLLGLYFAHTNPVFFREVYIREDGLVEWATAIALLAGAFTWLFRFVRLRRIRSARFLSVTLVFALLYLFGMGEELSWGQRIFDLESPEFFVTHNAQRETNLHNLVVGRVKINKLVFGAALALAIVLYLLTLPMLYRRFGRVRDLVDRWAIPVPQTRHVFCYAALFALVSLVPGPKRGELLELGGCFLFLLITLHPCNRVIFQRAELGRSGVEEQNQRALSPKAASHRR